MVEHLKTVLVGDAREHKPEQGDGLIDHGHTQRQRTRHRPQLSAAAGEHVKPMTADPVPYATVSNITRQTYDSGPGTVRNCQQQNTSNVRNCQQQDTSNLEQRARHRLQLQAADNKTSAR